MQGQRRGAVNHGEPGLAGEPRPVGHELQQLHVVLGEVTRPEGADVQHSDQIPAGEHRHAEQALDARGPQDRADHVRLADTFDHDRLPGQGDPSGEPAADRDPQVPAYLFLKALRGGGHQKLRVRVEQHDRRRVDSHQIPDPVQQLVEQVFRLEAGQRGIGHRLDSPQALDVAGVICLDHGCSVARGPACPAVGGRATCTDIIRTGVGHGGPASRPGRAHPWPCRISADPSGGQPRRGRFPSRFRG